jgi:hypothetical protein
MPQLIPGVNARRGYLLSLATRIDLTNPIAFDGAFGRSFAFVRPNVDVSSYNTDSITLAIVLKGRHDIAVDIVAASLHCKF